MTAFRLLLCGDSTVLRILDESLTVQQPEGSLSGDGVPSTAVRRFIRLVDIKLGRLAKSGTGMLAKSGMGMPAKSGTGLLAKSGTGLLAKSGFGMLAKSGLSVCVWVGVWLCGAVSEVRGVCGGVAR